MLCYDDEYFFEDLYDLLEHLDITKEDVVGKPDDYCLCVNVCKLEPIFHFDADFIADCIDDERCSEYGDEKHDVAVILAREIDFDKINSLMPKLWYPTSEKAIFSKEEILNTL